MIGERVGPYRIVEELGRGGYSEVFRAYHQEDSRDYALKILKEVPDKKARSRFARELEALRTLRHPNIIEVVSVGEHLERPFFTMPFVRVQSLETLMKQRIGEDRGRFTQDEVQRIAVDVARALRAAHSKGITHRDVKPGNVLVDSSFRPILCDFGLARLANLDTVTRQGTMLGTPRYMPPEQLQGRRTDGRGDLYSLGMMLYEMAAGRIPLAGDDPLASAIRRLTEDIPPLSEAAPHLDPCLTEAIHRCLDRDPNQRFQQASELIEILEGMPGTPEPLQSPESSLDTVEDAAPPLETPASSSGPTSSTPRVAPGSSYPSSEWMPRKPVHWVGVLALLGVAVSLPSVLLARRGPISEATCRVSPEHDRATLELRLDEPAQVRVDFGAGGQLGGFRESPSVSKEHRFVLEPLPPKSSIRYRLEFRFADDSVHQDKIQTFRTGKALP